MSANANTLVYCTYMYASVPFAEEPDGESKILPWNANEREINIWLTDNGYGSASAYTCIHKYICLSLYKSLSFLVDHPVV